MCLHVEGATENIIVAVPYKWADWLNDIISLAVQIISPKSLLSQYNTFLKNISG